MTRVTYFVLAPKANMVKIGQACEDNPPQKRLKSLQTGCPEGLVVLLTLPYRPPFEEKQLHFRFAQYRSHNEWFEYRDDLKDFIAKKLQNPAPQVEDDCAIRTTQPQVWKGSV